MRYSPSYSITQTLRVSSQEAPKTENINHKTYIQLVPTDSQDEQLKISLNIFLGYRTSAGSEILCFLLCAPTDWLIQNSLQVANISQKRNRQFTCFLPEEHIKKNYISKVMKRVDFEMFQHSGNLF
jgi:hypothetical protein